jgi:hypothetical protein
MLKELIQRRLENLCTATTECLLWPKYNPLRRYVSIRFRGGNWAAHRVVWTLVYGEIPEGQQVLHTCDNVWCIAPDHLFLGTHEDNMIDKAQKGRAPAPPSAFKTQCKHGHELTGRQYSSKHDKYYRYCEVCHG